VQECRMFAPGDSYAADLYTKDDPDRTQWEESAMCQVTDPEGMYRSDHGFKNIKKVCCAALGCAVLSSGDCCTVLYAMRLSAVSCHFVSAACTVLWYCRLCRAVLCAELCCVGLMV
jgi:hypothetical protein